MLPAVLLWIFGLLAIVGAAATLAVVYAALKIAARTDAIIGECKWDGGERWMDLCPSVGPEKPHRQWRMPHLPRRASI